MLRRFVNEARFTLRIETAGPLLVKKDTDKTSGKGQRGAVPDAIPMSTRGPDGREYYYIPGSSLKGVMRSHLEKIIRTLRHDDAQPASTGNSAGAVVDQGGQTPPSPLVNRRPPSIVCDPFVSAPDGVSTFADVGCGYKFAARYKAATGDLLGEEAPFIAPATAYAESCPVCRLFGSTSCAGRVNFDDAYGAVAKSAVTTEVRDGVGIDRLTGGPAHSAKFKFEVVPAKTAFEAHVLVRNFECWQLGALLLVLDDLAEGFVRIGSGRSRGLGAVGGGLTPAGIEIHTIRMPREKPDNEVWGIGRALGKDSPYATFPDDMLTTTRTPTRTPQGIRTVDTYVGDVLADLRTRAIADCIARVDGWVVPEAMAKEPAHPAPPSSTTEGTPTAVERQQEERNAR